MKIEVNIRDLIFSVILIVLFLFCFISFIEIKSSIKNAQFVNQVDMNSRNIQALDAALMNVKNEIAEIKTQIQK